MIARVKAINRKVASAHYHATLRNPRVHHSIIKGAIVTHSIEVLLRAPLSLDGFVWTLSSLSVIALHLIELDKTENDTATSA